MTNPLSWTFLKYIEACLQQITIANGYHTNAGQKVLLENYSMDSETDEFPVLRVIEDDADESGSGNTYTDGVVSVLVESYQRKFESQDAQINAHRVRSDMKKALKIKPKFLPAGVSSMDVVGARIIQPRDGMPFLVTQVALRARLIESNQSA